MSTPGPEHFCTPPVIYGVVQERGEGSRWRCPACSRRWVVKAPQGVVGRDHGGTLYWARRILPW